MERMKLQTIQHVETLLPVLQLPTDHQRAASLTFRKANQKFVLSGRLTQALQEFSREEGTSLFTTLLAAFQTMLYRYTGQEDLVVGTRVLTSGNLLGLRTRLAGDMSFRELLHHVAQVTNEVFANGQVSFAKLTAGVQEEQQCEAVMSQSTYQALFAWDSAREMLNGQHTFEIALEMGKEKADDRLDASLTYNAALFEEETIARMAGHYLVLLESIVSDADLDVSRLNLLTAAERHKLMVEWNDTTTDYGKDKSIGQLFEEQVAQTPENIAMVCGEQQWTYDELNQRINQLAHYLRIHGVGVDVRVGICMERSLEMIVGLMAILKAGGTYVPLDPAYPQERLTFMLEDAQVSVLVTEQQLVNALPEHAARVICLDTDRDAIAQGSTDNPEVAVDAETRAYVIFTSGSTGRPKGVCVPHRAVARLVKNTDYVSFSAAEVFLQFAPISFDASIFEIFGSLLNGAKLVLFPAGKASLEELGDVIQRYQVSTLWLTAGLFHQMVEGNLSGLQPVRQLLAGGDVLSVPHVKKVLQQLPGVHVINGYGPTESTTFTCCYTVTDEQQIGGSVPIGRPIANTEVYLLDRHLEPVPTGVPGELYIGGDGLAQGYLNRPDLTAERFIPSPFTAEDAYLYKTGDLVRYRSDGTIEFLGRIDNQVKIRGFRIELGEIETTLGQHPYVRENAVIAREDVPGEKRLVAYVIAQPNAELNTRELRGFLKGQLPDFMIPSAFVELTEFPLTPNGKVDYRALPAPDLSKREQDAEFVAPRTQTEARVAEIFSAVLGVEEVGATDHFFEMGGHSLQATQVISRIREMFAVSLPLGVLFDAPTVERVAESIQSAVNTGQTSQVLPLVPIARETELIPLSFAQQRLWFFDQFAPGNSMYNLPQAMRLNGQLNLAALQNALNEIVQRHEALRTTFVSVNDQPMQKIAESQQVNMQIVDLSHVPDNERETDAQRLMQKEAASQFDLEVGPLFRTLVIKLSEQAHLLVLNTHHIVSDGWSQGVFTNEFVALYVAFLTGAASPLPPLAVQYVDYAEWQKRWLQGDVLEQQLAYWKQQLNGELPVLQLPTDRPRPAVQTFNGVMQKFVLPKRLNEQLKVFSTRQGVTPFMTLLAAYNTLLYRYSGQEDILVGTAIAGRGQAELEGMIGFFVNMLVMRTDLSGNPTFRDLLDRVRQTALDAYAHQDLPFEKLVDALHMERTVSHSQLFQVGFSFVNVPRGQLELPGLTLEQVEVDHGASKFDITLFMEEENDELIGRWEYNSDLFDLSTIERMCGHFQVLLQSIVDAPDRPVAALPLLTETERQQLLVDWNDTTTHYGQHKNIGQLLEEQVAQTPDRIALSFGEQQLTYAQLNERVNQLTHYLCKQGVVKDMKVGLCLERSQEMIVGLLAILKAGGTYVPLDPTYPQERLTFMLEDAEIAVLVTTQELVNALPAHEARVIDMEAVREVLAAEMTSNPPAVATPETLAYVMFTSGSTGRPKGVCVPHRAVARLVKHTDYVSFSEDEVFLQYAPVSFDASTFEIFGSLLNGAELVVFPPGKASLEELGEVIAKHQVSTLWLTAGLFHQMVEANIDGLHPVKQLLAGGDVLSVPHVKKVLHRFPGICVINGYGPTESTTFTCCHTVSDPEQIGQSVPIGRPIANTTVYVLNAQMQPVPVGVPGELFIGGDGLAQGYLKRPDLTDEKFIPNPFDQNEEARLYSTGDLVRYRPNGIIEFIGRADNQVKIRGFRIELGEVEKSLAEHPAVAEVVVMAREDVPGNKRLVAYLVSEQGQALTVTDLRNFLKELVPDYMIPSAFVIMDIFPLNPTGKVDRRALPAPDQSRPELESAYVAPREETERTVAEIWEQILGIKEIGVHDNFFELGGNSLLATQVISRLRDALQVELSLRSIFEKQNVAELAEQIAKSERLDARLQAPSMKPVLRGTRMKLSFAQQRLYFFDQLEPGSPIYNIPIAVRLQGALNFSVLEQSLNHIVGRHEALRTTFSEENGAPYQIIAENMQTPLQMVDLQRVPTSERETRVMAQVSEEAWRPFDLTTGPLVRFSLYRLSDAEHILLFNMHHIVFDGWSLGILFAELGALYEAFLQGKQTPLVPMPIQYADFSHWQRQWMHGAVLEKQLTYWRGQLGGTLPVLQLPTDHPRPAVLSSQGALQRFELPNSLAEKLMKLSEQEGVTLYMVALAVWKTLLFRYTGQTDILVGSPIASRNRGEIENMIGFFVNTLVLRTELSGALTFRELVQRVRETALEAYAHQDLPFERLVEELQPRRGAGQMPLFQVMFVHVTDSELQLPGLTSETFEYDHTIAKFDLTLTLIETTQGLVGNVEYSTDLFAASTISSMIDHYRKLLEAVVADPTQMIIDLPMATAVVELDDEELDELFS